MQAIAGHVVTVFADVFVANVMDFWSILTCRSDIVAYDPLFLLLVSRVRPQTYDWVPACTAASKRDLIFPSTCCIGLTWWHGTISYASCVYQDPSHDGRSARSSYALLPRRAVLSCSLTTMQPESQGQAFLTAPWNTLDQKQLLCILEVLEVDPEGSEVANVGVSEPLSNCVVPTV